MMRSVALPPVQPSPGRVALVTGTSSGIGLHTAVGLARAGLHVVATVRNPARADPLRAAAAAADVDIESRPWRSPTPPRRSVASKTCSTGTASWTCW